jgi:hypothetical protein
LVATAFMLKMGLVPLLTSAERAPALRAFARALFDVTRSHSRRRTRDRGRPPPSQVRVLPASTKASDSMNRTASRPSRRRDRSARCSTTSSTSARKHRASKLTMSSLSCDTTKPFRHEETRLNMISHPHVLSLYSLHLTYPFAMHVHANSETSAPIAALWGPHGPVYGTESPDHPGTWSGHSR